MLGSLALLFEKDYEVERFSDGEAALKRLRENNFDLVIADLFLNGVTGLDLYEAARDKGRFLLITGYPERELAVKAKKRLGERFIAKTTAPEVLKFRVKNLVDRVPFNHTHQTS